jgi:hypothetical protein
VIEPTDEMRAAFRAERDEWCDNVGCSEDDCLNERLAAVLAIVERDLSAGWLIWSRYHRAWWKPEERGYTTDMMCAGRYERERADRIAGVRRCDDGTPGEVVVKAPEIGLLAAPNLMEKMRGRISAATRAAKRTPPL